MSMVVRRASRLKMGDRHKPSRLREAECILNPKP